ncbi:MAG: SGNH/GDSL hydrolase family protein [Bacteroidia bacterium]
MQQLLQTLTILLLLCLSGCKQDPTPGTPTPQPQPTVSLQYLALGDSYTVGQGVAEVERWPVQLTERLRQRGYAFEDAFIIARTGWTTQDLKKGLADATSSRDTFDLVSLLIGVNNQYRGQDLSLYVTEFGELLDQAVVLAGGRWNRVFVLSIPDYGVTPFGQNGDTARIAREIDTYNHIADSICTYRNIAFFDITPISRQALDDPSLIARDALHPSGKMYTAWVDLIQSGVEELLK